MGSERRLRLFIYARIIVSFLFLTATLLLQYQHDALEIERHQPGVEKLMAFSFLFSFISLFALRKKTSVQFITNLQVIWDLLFVTILILFTGGIKSPYSFLYLLSIMTAGMLLGKRQSLYAASLCGILYGTILDFHYFGYLSIIGLDQDDAIQFGAQRLFYTISFNLIFFGLTAFITAMLAQRAQLSEEALHRTSIDYLELEMLNSAIVNQSESGLMTTTINGNIRVFNPYAEHLTGLSQADIYDHHVSEVFAHIIIRNISESHEFEYMPLSGKMLTIGSRIAPFNNSEGVLIGYIINFRDITELKRMEVALKKADRLAAVGELSARMAHEIRNPLAALCGSVQLLASSDQLTTQDSRLLSIVTREASRLDSIISDFLLYARPTQPILEKIYLRRYVEEYVLFLSQSPLFKEVVVQNNISDVMTIEADYNQLHQVLVNLMKNSCEAMSGKGEIVVDAEIDADNVKLSITDSGPGLTDDTIKHMFEPFWTTKSTGTGLGLAISYRIIESHGGVLSVESTATGGCRFGIKLPLVPNIL